jgi:hypothetical protein
MSQPTNQQMKFLGLSIHIVLKECGPGWALVAHTCLGGSQFEAPVNSSQDPISKISREKQTGGVVQAIRERFLQAQSSKPSSRHTHTQRTEASSSKIMELTINKIVGSVLFNFFFNKIFVM